MKTKELIKEIQRLPINERILIVERTLKSIRMNQSKKRMEKAANVLHADYRSDDELTAFTDIDFDDFYETR